MRKSSLKKKETTPFINNENEIIEICTTKVENSKNAKRKL